VFNGVTNAILRASILMLYLRLFPAKSFAIQVWIVFAANAANMIAATLIILLQCIPLSMMWDRTIPGKCVNKSAAMTAAVGVNMALDLIVFLLPIPVLWGLKLSAARRARVCGVFLLGSG
jgi:hypothetical protein